MERGPNTLYRRRLYVLWMKLVMPCVGLRGAFFTRSLASLLYYSTTRRVLVRSSDNLNLTTPPPRRDFHKSSASQFGDRGNLASHYFEHLRRFADRSSKNMNVQSVVEDLTQTCVVLRTVLRSSKDEKEKEEIVLKHIKAYADSGVQVNDFAKGVCILLFILLGRVILWAKMFVKIRYV